MLDAGKMRAIGMMLARQARERAGSESTSANEVIDLAALLAAWRAGSYAAGDMAVYDGAPYRCVQTHDSTDNPEWTPPQTPAMWAPYHGTDRTHALPWQAPTGAQDAYHAGEWMIFEDGVAYHCLQDAVVWGPDVMKDAWEAET